MKQSQIETRNVSKLFTNNYNKRHLVFLYFYYPDGCKVFQVCIQLQSMLSAMI